MACSRGFFSGVRDFFAAPLRLWLMHKRLVQLNPTEKHLKTVQQHHLERTRRMQLRERLHDSYSSSSTGRLSDITTRASASADLVDSGGLIQPLVRIWLINVGLILSLALFSYLFSLIRANRLLDSWIFSSSSFHVVSQIISGLLHICLPLFMELVNMLYLKKICDRIALLRDIVPRDLLSVSQTDPSKSALGSTVMDRVYALIFFVLFQLQWTIIGVLASNYKISHLLNVFSVAFMYACYAIEYRWRQVPGML
ncbi:hypothetical protein AHF37_04570 [Paragonimus kellicotti]|nr:hypothetical protein AHF37_04570 [Paragonimus kellicotti]